MKNYKESRPWGTFEILLETEHTKVKQITVQPGQVLSYQYHLHRAEHWIVVSGRAEVVLNDEVFSINEGDAVYIPKEAKHGVTNPEETPLIFIEIQTGTYFGEDDIVRLKDIYGRV